MFKFNKAAGQICLIMLLLLWVANLQGCDSSVDNSAKTFSRGLEALTLIEPPPTPEPGGFMSLQIENVKSKLEISSLNQLAIVIAPQKKTVSVESIELVIYSADKQQLFSIRAVPTNNINTFNSVEKSGSNFTGYVFNLDAQKIDEANKFFISGNTIKLLPHFKRDSVISATFYLVDKQSEVTKKS